jgi:hypothetical protein
MFDDLQLGPDGVYCVLHLLLMYSHLSSHFLSGHCPGLVDIYPGDERTLKDFKLRIIGVYPGIHLFLIGIHLFVVGFHPFLVVHYHGFWP